jgi:hypothetical protein
MRRKLPKVLLVAVPFACGGNDNKKVDAKITIHDSTQIDSAPMCDAQAMYPMTGTGLTYGSGTGSSLARVVNAPPGTLDPMVHVQLFGGLLNNMAPPNQDRVYIEFDSGFGVFSGGDIKTGNFTIGPADAVTSTCGLCIDVWSHVTTTPMLSADQYYHAVSGTVNVTAVGPTPPVWTVTATNLVFHHKVTDNGGPGDADADSCVTMIPQITVNGRLATCTGSGSAFMCPPAIGKPDPIDDAILYRRHK